MNLDKLKGLLINDEGFAFDPRSGNTFNINTTGLLVINCIKAGASPARIVAELTEQFEIDEKAADRDLAAFLNELGRHKLVTMEVGS